MVSKNTLTAIRRKRVNVHLDDGSVIVNVTVRTGKKGEAIMLGKGHTHIVPIHRITYFDELNEVIRCGLEI